jgi:hypothetical protein
MLEELQQVAEQGGPASELAKDLLMFSQQYQEGSLSKEEYEFLVGQVAEVRAAQELANDEIMCRYIVEAAEALIAVV